MSSCKGALSIAPLGCAGTSFKWRTTFWSWSWSCCRFPWIFPGRAGAVVVAIVTNGSLICNPLIVKMMTTIKKITAINTNGCHCNGTSLNNARKLLPKASAMCSNGWAMILATVAEIAWKSSYRCHWFKHNLKLALHICPSIKTISINCIVSILDSKLNGYIWHYD